MPAPGEYTYFEQIGEEGRQHSINKPFSDAETPRLFFDMGLIFSLLPEPPAQVLDCGCGTGWLSHFLARKGFDVVGQDCNMDAIKMAEENPVFTNYPGSLNFVCSDFEKLGYEKEFDAVVFMASLHHSQAEGDAIASAYRALKPGGVFIAVEPGRGHGEAAAEVTEEFDLGDRDMPPHLVMAHGKRLGFRERIVYQHAGQLTSSIYNQQPNSRKLQLLWKIPGGRLLALFASLVFMKRYNGTVFMRK